jgi:RNA exonuclease 1
VLLKRDNGDVASFYVRKMAYGAQLNKSELSNKRPPPTEHVEPTKEDNDGDKQKKRKTGKKHEKKKAKISVAE